MMLNDTRQRGILLAGVIIALALHILRTAPSLNPASLWLDDLWVAVLVKHASVGMVPELGAHVPLGFIAIQKLFHGLISDPELSMQLFPYLCSLLLIPAVTLAVFALSRDLPTAWMAALITAVSPLIDTGIRNKPYASDALVCFLLFFLFYRCRQQRTFRLYALLAAAALISVLFSYVSIFFGFVLVNLLNAHALRDRRNQGVGPKSILLSALGFNVCLALLYFVFLRGSANQSLADFWMEYFVPIHGVGAFFGFCFERGGTFVTGPFPKALWWMSIVVIPGLVWLVSRWRLLGLGALGIYGCVWVASALGKYPIGGGRTDTFAYPLTILLSVVGLYAVTDRLKSEPGRRLRWVLVLALAVFVFHRSATTPVRYVPDTSAEYLRLAAENTRAGDAIIIFPHGNFALGYYGSWPVELAPVSYYAAGFEVRLPTEPSLTLPAIVDGRSYRDDPEVLTPLIADFLNGRFPRVIYFSGHVGKEVSRHIQWAIKSQGYTASRSENGRANDVVVFEKTQS